MLVLAREEVLRRLKQGPTDERSKSTYGSLNGVKRTSSELRSDAEQDRACRGPSSNLLDDLGSDCFSERCYTISTEVTVAYRNRPTTDFSIISFSNETIIGQMRKIRVMYRRVGWIKTIDGYILQRLASNDAIRTRTCIAKTTQYASDFVGNKPSRLVSAQRVPGEDDVRYELAEKGRQYLEGEPVASGLEEPNDE